MSQLTTLARFRFSNELLFVRHQRKDVPAEKHSQLITSLTKTKRFTGGDIFSILDNYFSKNALWKNCASKTTQAAAAVTTTRDSRVRLQG